MIVTTALILFVFWIIYHMKFLLMHVPLLRNNKTDSGAMELVSIIVPARNEERNIIPCLETLTSLDYEKKEIIVVNDRSEDRTEELVREFIKKHPDVRILNGKELPPGWIGKTYALYQGLKNANGNLILFTDADTRHSSENLKIAVQKLKQDNVAVVSILPYLEAVTFWEKVVQPFVAEMFMVSMPFDKVNDPKSRVVLASGQFFLTYKNVLESIGGLETIKENILDDIALARIIKDKGYGIYLCYGEKLFTVRMYTNFKEIVNGWSKNFYRGFTLNYPGIAVAPAILAVLAFYVLPLLLPLIAVLVNPSSTTVSVSFLPLILEILLTYIKRKKHDLYPETAWAMPLGALIYSYIMINSTVRSLLGIGVQWKGRSYYKKG